MKKICRITIDTERKMANSVIAPLLLDNCINFSIKDIEVPTSSSPYNGKLPTAAPYYPRDHGNRSWDNSQAPKALLSGMEPGKEYHYKTLAQALLKVGMNPTSATPCLSWMTRQGMIERVVRGRYRLPSLPKVQ